MQINTTYNMDANEAAKLLPDSCVDCIVTSPPYFGLRDYGTATWLGGDPACDHKGQPMRTRANINRHYSGCNDVKNAEGHEPYKSTCGKCGAIRVDKQLGLEDTPEQYVERLVLLFRELRRALKDEGTIWVNLGDSYAGSGKGQTRNLDADWCKETYNQGVLSGGGLRPASIEGAKPKDLLGIPWRVALALQADGWYLRSDIIWNKTNPMPESVTDRPTKSHEYIFLLSKSERYYYDAEAIRERVAASTKQRLAQNVARQKGSTRVPGKKNGNMKAVGSTEYRNKRSVWEVATRPFKEAHFATFPEKLIVPCILAGCPAGGLVLDPFNGSGTTRLVANKLGRNAIGFELNPDYIKIEERRRCKELGIFNTATL